MMTNNVFVVILQMRPRDILLALVEMIAFFFKELDLDLLTQLDGLRFLISPLGRHFWHFRNVL